MKFNKKGVAALAGFRPFPTTVLLVVLYGVILSSVLITDRLSAVPKSKRREGLNLEQAMQDLYFVRFFPPQDLRIYDG